jgi:4,5-dihydroxyphthalate decarboxylase
MGPRERHWRMGRKHEFDVCEENVGAYYMIRDQGEPLTAIPVFLHRRFRHGFVFVNTASGHPRAEGSQRQGRRRHQLPAGVQHLDARHPGGALRPAAPEHHLAGRREEDIAFDPPPGPAHRMKKSAKTLPQMLADGDIPAMISPTLAEAVRRGRQADRAAVRRLQERRDRLLQEDRDFPDHACDDAEEEIADKYPWVATNLVKAFEAARTSPTAASPIRAWRRSCSCAPRSRSRSAIFGKDPWSYGLTPANRKNLETVQRYSHQQGMIKRIAPLDELFADTDLGEVGSGAAPEEF